MLARSAAMLAGCGTGDAATATAAAAAAAAAAPPLRSGATGLAARSQPAARPAAHVAFAASARLPTCQAPPRRLGRPQAQAPQGAAALQRRGHIGGRVAAQLQLRQLAQLAAGGGGGDQHGRHDASDQSSGQCHWHPSWRWAEAGQHKLRPSHSPQAWQAHHAVAGQAQVAQAWRAWGGEGGERAVRTGVGIGRLCPFQRISILPWRGTSWAAQPRHPTWHGAGLGPSCCQAAPPPCRCPHLSAAAPAPAGPAGRSWAGPSGSEWVPAQPAGRAGAGCRSCAPRPGR